MQAATGSFPPRKPARTSLGDQELEQEPQSLTKDAVFWFHDGTIVLTAGNVEFRVYRGPLEAHSPFFRDMLSLPQPPASQASASCPVIQLLDSPNDVRHMLRAFVAGESVEPFGPQAPSFHTVSAWIRLGHKYQIDKLVEDGMAYLRRFYPSWIEGDLVIQDDPPPESMSGEFAIGVVNLARLTQSRDILPLALLECCMLGRDITRGYAHEDGTREYLGGEDVGRCFGAMDLLALKSAEACVRVLESAAVDPYCFTPEVCIQVLDARIGAFKPHFSSFVNVSDMLIRGAIESILYPEFGPQLCPMCRERVEQLIRVEQQDYWDALYYAFELNDEE